MSESEKAELVKSFELDYEDAIKNVDSSVAKEEYGDAAYFRGKLHACALALLRIRRLIAKPDSETPSHSQNSTSPTSTTK